MVLLSEIFRQWGRNSLGLSEEILLLLSISLFLWPFVVAKRLKLPLKPSAEHLDALTESQQVLLFVAAVLGLSAIPMIILMGREVF